MGQIFILGGGEGVLSSNFGWDTDYKQIFYTQLVGMFMIQDHTKFHIYIQFISLQ
jgi:hypothetical protein